VSGTVLDANSECRQSSRIQQFVLPSSISLCHASTSESRLRIRASGDAELGSSDGHYTLAKKPPAIQADFY
jgi:hypothetical protein